MPGQLLMMGMGTSPGYMLLDGLSASIILVYATGAGPFIIAICEDSIIVMPPDSIINRS